MERTTWTFNEKCAKGLASSQAPLRVRQILALNQCKCRASHSNGTACNFPAFLFLWRSWSSMGNRWTRTIRRCDLNCLHLPDTHPNLSTQWKCAYCEPIDLSHARTRFPACVFSGINLVHRLQTIAYTHFTRKEHSVLGAHETNIHILRCAKWHMRPAKHLQFIDRRSIRIKWPVCQWIEWFVQVFIWPACAAMHANIKPK